MEHLEFIVSSGDAARALGVTSARVRQLAELAYIRLPNGARRYRLDDVRKLVEKRAAVGGTK
jgi:hypothetical protein